MDFERLLKRGPQPIGKLLREIVFVVEIVGGVSDVPFLEKLVLGTRNGQC